MKVIAFLSLLICGQALAKMAAVDPGRDTEARGLFLAESVVQEQIDWVTKQTIDGSTFSDYRIITREEELPPGFDPELHSMGFHYLMFPSNDWRFLCQVSTKVLWKRHENRLSIEASGLASESVCFPRM